MRLRVDATAFTYVRWMLLQGERVRRERGAQDARHSPEPAASCESIQK